MMTTAPGAAWRETVMTHVVFEYCVRERRPLDVVLGYTVVVGSTLAVAFGVGPCTAIEAA